MVGTTMPSTHVEYASLEPDASGRIETVIRDWHLFEYVAVIVTNFDQPPGVGDDALALRYDAVEEGYPVVDVTWWKSQEKVLRNAPDPFSLGTQVRFQVEGDSRARVAIFDARGRHVADLVNGLLPAGTHNRMWDGRDHAGRPVAGGVYFVVLETGGRRVVEKVVAVR
jgi:hypothetical protein